MGVGDSMASYDIQFQKGLSLREFNATYATEEQCREAICKARWGEGFVCPECGSTRHCRLARGLFQSILPRLLAAAVSTPAMPQRLLKVAWMAGVA
jgi:hypothetical protein